MTEVEIQNDGDFTKVVIKGHIDESTDLIKEIPTDGNDLILDCSAISRVNSYGIRNWVLFMKEVKKAKKNLKIIKASPAIVDQLNMISDFSLDYKVESILIPYWCTNCRKQTLPEFKTDALANKDWPEEIMKCSHCDSEAELDEVLEAYLNFLT